MGNSKLNVSNASSLFFSDILSAQNLVRVMEGKIVYDQRDNKNYSVELAGGSNY